MMFFAAPRITKFAGVHRLPAAYPWREAVAKCLTNRRKLTQRHSRRLAEHGWTTDTTGLARPLMCIEPLTTCACKGSARLLVARLGYSRFCLLLVLSILRCCRRTVLAERS